MKPREEDELRLYRDGQGVTHRLAWDDDTNVWYHVCNARLDVPGKRNDDHDALIPFPTCIRCMSRPGHLGFFAYEEVGDAVVNVKALHKLNFDLGDT